MQVQPDFHGYRASVQVDNWRAHVESSGIRVDQHCYLHLYITKYFFLTFIAHCHWWTTHPLNHISTYVQEQMSLHLSLQGWCRGFLFMPWIFFFWQDLLPFCFTLMFYPCMFSLCALPFVERERLTDWGGQMTIQVWVGANPSSGFATQGRRWREGKGCRSISQRYKSQRQTSKTPELSSTD